MKKPAWGRAQAQSSLGRWIKYTGYAVAVLALGKQAVVNFRLTVDEIGKPSACKIQRSYNDKAFDNATCDASTRA